MSKYPKIGIRPTIDGRQGGVRESLEEKTRTRIQTLRREGIPVTRTLNLNPNKLRGCRHPNPNPNPNNKTLKEKGTFLA